MSAFVVFFLEIFFFTIFQALYAKKYYCVFHVLRVYIKISHVNDGSSGQLCNFLHLIIIHSESSYMDGTNEK